MSLRRFFFGPGNRSALSVGAGSIAYMLGIAAWFYFVENSVKMALWLGAVSVCFGYWVVKMRREALAFEDRMRELVDE